MFKTEGYISSHLTGYPILEYSSLILIQPLLANLLKTFVKLPCCNVCETVYVTCMSRRAIKHDCRLLDGLKMFNARFLFPA